MGEETLDMCDKPHFEALENRVDGLEIRMTTLETSVAHSREENKQGFSDIKAQLNQMYSERSEWGKMAREIVQKVVKWLLWLIPALCGLKLLEGYIS